MATCPNCGEENLDKAKFCLECGTSLKGSPRFPAEERKVVSILFVDLVGFTARSHQADPEDVRAALKPYHERLKQESERFGGTVAKFVGDAVMAVFGVPVAHEDDAERAVRAALRITEAIHEMNEANAAYKLAIRGAVETGEVFVSPTEEMGRGLLGDVINTASRLQSVAPVNGIVVGETTYRCTRDLIDYQQLDPATVKGKPVPIPIWKVIAARSRTGVLRYTTPFVGRDLDLTTLETAYQRVLRESSLGLLTVVGEPGIGKSRLLGELSSYVDEQPGMVSWRQGRSLPYGEGTSFWALGEVFKAQAGILESDGPREAADKLQVAIEAVVEDPSEHEWFKVRLAPLVGASVDGSTSAEKEESFAGWRRFLEAVASRNALVVVFEDLHWADPSLLEFIEHLVDWSTGVPLLVVCTTRPELFEKHPGWGGGNRNWTTISLSPLSNLETAELVSGLLAEAVLPAETLSTLLEQAGGNPLYTEEFIRMLRDRGILKEQGTTLALDRDVDIPMPDTVQALIAARLDTLASEQKTLLHNAAVVGKTFWSQAVAAVGDMDEQTIDHELHELARKEFVHPSRTSSIQGQQEFTFWHAIVQQVSYSQIPRAARVRKHKAMAQWLEHLTGDRISDVAEIIAHHYREAWRLAEASGAMQEAVALHAPTQRFLILAAEQARYVDARKAKELYDEVLQRMDPGSAERGRTLLGAAKARWDLALWEEAERQLLEALSSFRASSDPLGEGEALALLSHFACELSQLGKTKALAIEAIDLLEAQAPSRSLAYVYSMMALQHSLLGEFDEALDWYEKTLSVARELDDLENLRRALMGRGDALCELDDLEGLDDLKEALQVGKEIGDPVAIASAQLTLGQWVWLTEGPQQALELYRGAVDFAEQRSITDVAHWGRGETLWMLFDSGLWDSLLEEAENILKWNEKDALKALVLPYQALVWHHRGRHSDALEGVERSLQMDFEELQILIPALAVTILVHEALGNRSDAMAAAGRFAAATQGRPNWRTRFLPDIVRVLYRLGENDLARELITSMPTLSIRRSQLAALTAEAIFCEANGDLEEAADAYRQCGLGWAKYRHDLEQGQALLGEVRCLIALNRPSGASPPLFGAREIFHQLGARQLLAETDVCLRRVTAMSS
ncbi:MAG: AAA family ATPase [Actinomycetota bacterium]|nr:AAA family ATPase [Actinomycetota bacterium]